MILAERPLDATAWIRLAWISDQKGDDVAMLDALDRSYVAAPYWAERLVKMRQIDTHIFYRWTGAWGLPGAFTGAHAGVEPVIAKLSAVATHIEELGPAALEVEALPSLDLTPIVTLIRPEQAEGAQGPAIVEETVTTPPPVEIVAVPPAPPPVLASPLDALRGVTPQRRARIATPR